MRQIWKAISVFHVPITHPFIQNLTDFDLDFIDWASALDNPVFYDKMINTVYDDDYEDYEQESENEELTDEEKALMEQIIANKDKPKGSIKPNSTDDFIPVDNSKVEDVDDWEEVT